MHIALADLFRLDGRVALVTGASSPIGAAISEALAEAGATVICAARNVAKGRETAERVLKAGGKAIALPLDLSDEASITQLHAAASAQVGIVDTLVHNAMSQLLARRGRLYWVSATA
jgi:gluconate 5-dehydrogenase